MRILAAMATGPTVRRISTAWRPRAFLFDLSRDARERADMKRREPKVFDELRGAYAVCDAGLPATPTTRR